jgi:hypothetical protein
MEGIPMMNVPMTLPDAAIALNYSLDRLRALLSANPKLAAQIPRVGGRRLIGPVELVKLREAIDRKGAKRCPAPTPA